MVYLYDDVVYISKLAAIEKTLHKMKILLFIVSSFSFITLHGQSYDTKMIIDKADSILRNSISEHVYQYFKFDSGSYYIYSGFFRDITFYKDYRGTLNSWGVKRLIKNKKTKGNFNSVDVRFIYQNPDIKEVSGLVFIKFDSQLKLVEPLYLDFIPDFVLENRPCDFITKETALKIAKDSLNKKGLYEIEAYLGYDAQRKRYTYEIENTLTEEKDFRGNNTGNVEVIIIDAITKEILYHDISWYGPIY